MAAVDPDDDDIRRYVVLRNAYDPDRRQRRWIVVAAFNRRREGRSLYRSLIRDLEHRHAAGEIADPYERYSGEIRHPGDRRRRENTRVWRDASRRGVSFQELSEQVTPPEDMVFLQPRRRGGVGRFIQKPNRGRRHRLRDRLRPPFP